MSAALVTAWIVIALTGSGQPVLSKQVRIDPIACHLPAVRAEYPVGGQWRPVTIRISCAR
ncbi:MAG: hypothetical protein ACLQIQ_08480 [Beijerinckiaceae bacterium]